MSFLFLLFSLLAYLFASFQNIWPLLNAKGLNVLHHRTPLTKTTYPLGSIRHCLANGFSPRQVHYEFSVAKEKTLEHSWGERVIANFTSSVAGQSLKSHSLRVSLHTASRSLPLGLSAPQLSSGPLSFALPPLQPLLSLLHPCNHATEPWAELFI